MTFHGIVDDEQLATLIRIMDEYCEQAGIEGSHPAREHLARRLIALFTGGIDNPDEIRKALDSASNGWQSNHLDLAITSEGSKVGRFRRGRAAQRIL